MISYIKDYYTSERNMAIVVASIGLLLLALGWFLLRKSQKDQAMRGLSYVVLVSGLFFFLAIGVVFYFNAKIVETASYTQSDQELQRTEAIRMEKVLASSYLVSKSASVSIAIFGLLLFLISARKTVKGIGIGLVLFGSLWVTIESVSSYKNNAYYQIIKK